MLVRITHIIDPQTKRHTAYMGIAAASGRSQNIGSAIKGRTITSGIKIIKYQYGAEWASIDFSARSSAFLSSTSRLFPIPIEKHSAEGRLM